MKPRFVTPGQLMAEEARRIRREQARLVKGRGALAHATGTRFIDGPDTTRAVRRRMENMEFYLRGEVPPVR